MVDAAGTGAFAAAQSSCGGLAAARSPERYAIVGKLAMTEGWDGELQAAGVRGVGIRPGEGEETIELRFNVDLKLSVLRSAHGFQEPTQPGAGRCSPTSGRERSRSEPYRAFSGVTELLAGLSSHGRVHCFNPWLTRPGDAVRGLLSGPLRQADSTINNDRRKHRSWDRPGSAGVNCQRHMSSRLRF